MMIEKVDEIRTNNDSRTFVLHVNIEGREIATYPREHLERTLGEAVLKEITCEKAPEEPKKTLYSKQVSDGSFDHFKAYYEKEDVKEALKEFMNILNEGLVGHLEPRSPEEIAEEIFGRELL